MLLVVLDSFVKVFRILLTHLHEVHTDAVVSKSFTMDVSDRATNLKELFVLIHCKFILSKIVIENTS